MSSTSSVKVGRTEAGYRVRVEGDGTMRSSPAVHAFVLRSLEDPSVSGLIIDLSTCVYLDSTFLGCLVDLHKRYGAAAPPRFQVAAPPATLHRLFGTTRLDRLLKIVPAAPETVGNEVELSADENLALPELGRHLLECHRRLAEVDGPNQVAFQRIVDRLEAELGLHSPVARS